MDEATTTQEVSGIKAELSPEEATPAPAGPQGDVRVDDLERRIRELEAAISDLRTVTAAAAGAAGRKTQSSYAPRLQGKGLEPVGPGSVDAALGSLSIEQRMTVKAGLLRAGLL